MDTATESPRRGPAFGLATATFVVISSMVGTGVLTTSGYTVLSAGSNQWMLILWVVGGVIAACGALTLCELSAAMPKSGGDYIYLSEAYGPLAGFLAGWVSFLIGFGGPIAVSASAASRYALAPLRLEGPAADLAQRALATAAILAFAAVHISGRARTIRVQAGITVIKLGILGVLALAGLAAGRGHGANLDDRTPLTPALLVTLASSFVYISYAYVGWNAASYIAGEVKNPQKSLPRAILFGTGLVMVLYLALNVFYALALSAADVRALVESPANRLPVGEKVDVVAPIAQLAAERLLGPRVSDPLSVAIGLTLLASVSAYVLTGPRVAYAMALAGQFPSLAGRLSPRFETPAAATVLQVAWSLALLWSAKLDQIMVYSSVGLALFSMLTVGAVFVLRVRRPDLPRPFRTPGYPAVPALYLLGTALFIAAVFHDRPHEAIYSLVSILAGVPVYYLWVAFRGRATPGVE
jgi:APA family basic amino acid/polyamine antiporter